MLRKICLFCFIFCFFYSWSFANTCPTSTEINASQGSPKGWIKTALSEFKENASYDFVSAAKEGLLTHHVKCSYYINHDIFKVYHVVSVQGFNYPSHNLPLPNPWFERSNGEIACIEALESCIFMNK